MPELRLMNERQGSNAMKASSKALITTLRRAGAIIIIADTAVAQEIPQYDPAVHCKRVAEISGKYSEVIDWACLAEERIAFDALKPRWGAAPANVREQCDQLSRIGGDGFHTTLQTCVDRELNASRLNPKKKVRN